MKKISLFVLISFLSISFTMAQNYDELLAKGKSYEGKNQFAYALGYYYDAMNVEKAGPEAKEKFDSLKSEIENGNPGYGEFSLLTMQKGWTALFKDYYRYFTEFSPLDIYFYKLELGKVDYETETAEYMLPYVLVPTNKYKTIKNILMSGVKKNSREDWGSLNEGIVPYSILQSYETKVEAKKNEIKRIYSEEKIALVGYRNYSRYDKPYLYFPAGFAAFYIKVYSSREQAIDGTVFDDTNGGYYSLYDIQFDIYDENNNLLLSGKRQNCGIFSDNENPKNVENLRNVRKYIFTDEGAKILNKVEKNKNLIIKPKAVYLNYGYIVDDLNQDLYWVGDEHRELQRQIYKPLMDTQIILQNIKVIDYYKNLEDIEKARLQKLAEEAAAREEAARIEREAREEAERIEREAELARQEKLRLEKEVRLNAFLETSTISAEYAAEIFSSFIESYPKVIRIVGDVTNYWNDINQALSEINSGLFFELDLLNTEGLIVFPMISCKNIEGIFLPNGCERISTKAFYDCPNIKKISIPKSVKNIDESAFENCKSLETVDYSGSKKDWKAIKIEKNNKPIQKAKINYE